MNAIKNLCASTVFVHRLLTENHFVMIQEKPRVEAARPGTWISWNENVQHDYDNNYTVHTEEELIDRIANAEGKIRMYGHRYSSADISAGNPTLLDLTEYDKILHYNDARREITVQSGITLKQLLQAVEAKGWAIPCLPDIDGITLGGAIATGTHGTGREGQILAQYMTHCRLIKSNGEVLDIDEHDTIMPAVRVSMGVLGIMSQITMRCVPNYTLHLKEAPMHDDEWTARLDELHAAYDFLRILWMPHTDHGYVIRGNRIDPDTPVTENRGPDYLKHRRKASKWLYKYTYKFPRLTAFANKFLYKAFFTVKKEHKGSLYQATVTKKRGSTMELAEWTIARSRFPALFKELKAALDSNDNDAFVHVPMDIRFLKEDDSWLSYAYGEDCVTIGCVCRDSPNADSYEAFKVVEQIFLKHGGRPHWAKRFEAKAPELSRLYPKWRAFNELRRQMDPEGQLLNPYLAEVFGESTPA